MKLVVQNEAKAMFGSVKQDMNSGLRFSTVSEKNNAEQIGKIMSQWTLGASAMSADVRNKHAVNETLYLLKRD
jgi:nucleoside diphosphate kinase